MIKINKKFIDWTITHNDNLLLAGMITFLAPLSYIKSYYHNNIDKRTSWHGKNACLTISFDCDYPQDVEYIPQVMKLFARYQLKTSFACVGHWIEKYPNEHLMLLDHGHEIVNHTYSHPDNEILNPGRKFREISREEKIEEISRCHDICRKLLGYEPTGCRIPHFKNLFTPDIYGILKDLNYIYSSSTWITNTRSYGAPFLASEGIYEYPLTTCPKHPFTVFDTWHSLNSPHPVYKLGHRTTDAYKKLFMFLIDLAIETHSYMNVYIDPYDIAKIEGFDEILSYIQERQNEIWVATYQEMHREMKDSFQKVDL
ncbi:MAG: hypothetical protein A2293_11740 [Elusimicrobia bacterium RIFOXYB2_FULL_49_7]|nr:MAG: hypothetical protein A2293_11740 [Elusimicrobia bacterium RIFOXYB2_FULL_49_7]